MSAHDFFKNGADAKGLGAYLDGLSEEQRVLEVRSLSGKELAALYDAASGPLTLEYFVGPDVAPLREVIHEGKNSLPLFSSFQKRFCRPAPGATELWGYNEQAMRWATGPGYFKARIVDGGVLIDYLEVPSGAPPQGWPAILPNSAGLSRFVYYQTQDAMRGVSKHVSIGRASKKGEPMDAWFALCRRDSR